MIDIDELKKVNDMYGHTEGDRLLAEFGKVLAAYAADIIQQPDSDPGVIYARLMRLRP